MNRGRRWSGQGRWLIPWAVLAMVPVAAGLWALSVGPAVISASQVAGIVSHAAVGWPPVDWEPWQAVIVLQVRLPRVVVGLLVGGGLAVCGAVMQGIFRNPMADPGVIGVAGGASLGAVLALYYGLAAVSVVALPAVAFVGAVTCGFVVYIVATSRGETSITTLLLAGIAIKGITAAVTSLIISFSLANYDVGRQIVFWLLGGLDARTWSHVRIAGPLVLGGSMWALLYARELNVLSTGEEVALSVGVDVRRVRRNLLVLSSAVTAAAVAVSGEITFVGLIVPHVMRLLIGPDHRRLLPASFLAGASLLVLADMVARTVIAPTELRLGIITALAGGPFFLYLLIKQKRRVEAP